MVTVDMRIICLLLRDLVPVNWLDQRRPSSA
jgi:hypothetical protein